MKDPVFDRGPAGESQVPNRSPGCANRLLAHFGPQTTALPSIGFFFYNRRKNTPLHLVRDLKA
jgi:hypothetical protein